MMNNNTELIDDMILIISILIAIRNKITQCKCDDWALTDLFAAIIMFKYEKYIAYIDTK